MAGVALKDVTKRFRDASVLESINISIEDGEFFTFVGPSGCGKSTVLNIIAGLEAATGGGVLFDGVPVNGMSPRDRDVAMVFQSYALYPHMNVFENLAFPLKMKKQAPETIRKEVQRTASMLGLEGLLGRKPRELSGGQRQRVALGRAVIRRPRAFLMDEPLSNLDARLRVGMRAELKKLHQELKITTIYVTHDQAEAMGLSDRMAVLHEGGIQQCGTPLEVYARPSNIFVAGFIGSPPMCLMEAPVKEKEPLVVTVNGVPFRPRAVGPPASEAVTLGIRPEDLTVTLKETPVIARAVLKETEGPATWVNVDWDGVTLKGRADNGEGIAPGLKVFLRIPDEKLHVFEKETGKRV
jgi:multiple sugar transport system ATP-binding protein